MLRLELATQAHVDYLAPRLRQADKDEIKALGCDPQKGLQESFECSEPAFSGVDEQGNCVIMFGATTYVPGILAMLWMLSSDDIYKHRIQFLKESRKYLDELNKRWPILFNFCDVRNTDHIRWMQWLDYTFINRHECFGQEQRPFYEFVRVRRD